MAEKRFVPCSLFSSDYFMDLTQQERLIWLGLVISVADDQGRLQDNARFIRSCIFPSDNINDWEIEKSLLKFDELQQIYRYSDTRGKKLIQIVDWWKDYQDSRFINVSKFQPPENWIDKENINCSEQKAIQLKNEIPDREIIKPKSDPGNHAIKRNLDKSGGFTKYPDRRVMPLVSELEASCTPSCTPSCIPSCTLPYDSNSNSTGAGNGASENERNQARKTEIDLASTSSGSCNNFSPSPDPDPDPEPDLKPAAPESLHQDNADPTFTPENLDTAHPRDIGTINYVIQTISGQEINLSSDQLSVLLNYFLRVGSWLFQDFLEGCYKELPNAEFVDMAIFEIRNDLAPLPAAGVHNENKS